MTKTRSENLYWERKEPKFSFTQKVYIEQNLNTIRGAEENSRWKIILIQFFEYNNTSRNVLKMLTKKVNIE